MMRWWYGPMDNWFGTGFGIMGFGMMILFWGLIIGLIVALVRFLSNSGRGEANSLKYGRQWWLKKNRIR